jgi:hypothetical protein
LTAKNIANNVTLEQAAPIVVYERQHLTKFIAGRHENDKQRTGSYDGKIPRRLL